MSQTILVRQAINFALFGNVSVSTKSMSRLYHSVDLLLYLSSLQLTVPRSLIQNLEMSQ